MLKYLNEDKAALLLEDALRQVIKEGKFVTYDLKPQPDDASAVGTSEMADAVIAKIKEKL